MGTTAKGLWYPDGTDTISPIHPHLAAMQTSVDNALSGVRVDTPAGIHEVADTTGLATLLTTLTTAGYSVSASNPVYAYRADNQTLYRNIGAGWVEMTNTMPVVRYDAQTLTSPQQTQARTNVGAASQTDLTNLTTFLTPTTKVNGTSGSWTWWYREIGYIVELYVNYSGTVAADASIVLTQDVHLIPLALFPGVNFGFPVSGTSTRRASSRINGMTGALSIRNEWTSSVTGFDALGNWIKP